MPDLSIFSAAAVRTNFENWYRGVLDRHNTLAEQQYQQDHANWQLNDTQRRALGLPLQPPPERPTPLRWDSSMGLQG